MWKIQKKLTMESTIETYWEIPDAEVLFTKYLLSWYTKKYTSDIYQGIYCWDSIGEIYLLPKFTGKSSIETFMKSTTEIHLGLYILCWGLLGNLLSRSVRESTIEIHFVERRVANCGSNDFLYMLMKHGSCYAYDWIYFPVHLFDPCLRVYYKCNDSWNVTIDEYMHACQ